MTEWIITSAVLIVVVAILRQILKGKISLRLQYALWALVLIRLLVPISFGQTGFSVLNAVPEQNTAVQIAEPEDPVTSDPVSTPVGGSIGNTSPVVIPSQSVGSPVISDRPVLEPDPVASPDPGTVVDPVASPEPPVEEIPEEPATISVTQVLNVLWVAGIAMVALWFLISNLSFWLRLRRSRRLLEADAPIKVYVTGAVETPCLFGLIRPAIYVTPEVAADGVTMHHVLAHELTHHRHWDHIWSVLRCVCLAVHWYNPLVWLAASLSRRDAELACDESTIRRIGEEERAAYGRTLIGLTCVHRSNLLHTATTMTGSKKCIKERIVLIAKKPKMAVYTLVAVILIAAIAVGCTFTGAERSGEEDVESLFSAQTATKHWEIIESVEVEDLTYGDVHDFAGAVLYRDYENNTAGVAFVEEDGYYSLGLSAQVHADSTLVYEGAGTVLFYLQTEGGEPYECRVTLSFSETGVIQLHSESEFTEPPAFVQSVAETYIEQRRAAVEQEMPAISVTHEVLSELKDLSELDLGTADLYYAVEMWQLDYDITVALGRQDATTTAHTVFLVVLYDCMANEYTQILGAVDLQTLQDVYNTPEMIGKYNDMYRAAAVELYHDWQEEQTDPVDPEADLIAYFQNLLTFDGGESWYNGALTCVYDDPRDMDLSYVFYVPFNFLDDVGWEDFTAEEEAYLISQGFYREMSAQKRHGIQLNVALQQYFGISLYEARIPDGWVYYEGTNSYYSNTNDIHVMEDFTVTKVVQGEDGLVYVYYTAEGPIFRQDGTSLDGWEHDMVLTLRDVASNWSSPNGHIVLANQTQKEFEDSYSAVGTAVDPAQIVNHILVGRLMYDNSWQSMGSFTLTSTAADGRVDTYVSEPSRFSGLDSTPGGYMAAEYEWTEIDASQWTGLAGNEYSLTFANDRYSVTVYSNENKLELQVNGETRYFAGNPKYESHGDFSNLFNLFRQYADDALWDHEMAACQVSGSETDYDLIARKLAEQYAQIILDRPGWAYGQALDVKVDSIKVTDAYYGEDNPNFCFAGLLPLKVTEQQRWYWEVGSGLPDPFTSGPYVGYYGYGLGADAKKCEDGNWHMTGMWTGGESVALPVSLDDATVQQLMELYFLTEGKTHDWRIVYRLAEKPLEEVAAQLKQLEPEQRRELTSAIAALIEEYPEYAAWSAAEFEVAAKITAVMGNTEIYRCEGDDPYEAAVELITAYVEDLMVSDDLRSFTITQYRNLTVEIQPTLEMSDAAISRYNYDLSEEEIGENIWIVEFNMEYRWEGVLHGPPCGPSTGVPDDYWESQVHQGSPLGFLLTRNGNEFTLQSRYDTRY